LALALRLGAARVIEANGQFDVHEAARAAWIFACEHLGKTRAAVEDFERMPPAEQRRELAELAQRPGRAV
jgi:hypothetical protein